MSDEEDVRKVRLLGEVRVELHGKVHAVEWHPAAGEYDHHGY